MRQPRSQGRQYPDGPLEPPPGVVTVVLMHDPGEMPPEGFCRVYWGSHGCHRPRGHDPAVPHECDCCDCGEHHPYPGWPDTGVRCVARAPYYGPDTRFYGEEAEALGLPLADGS